MRINVGKPCMRLNSMNDEIMQLKGFRKAPDGYWVKGGRQ